MFGDSEGLSSVIFYSQKPRSAITGANSFSHAIEVGALVFVPGLQVTQFDFHNPVHVSKNSESHVRS